MDGQSALLAMLTGNDLNAFTQQATQNNIFSQLAQPILGTKFDTSTWSPGTSAGVKFAQALLGGLSNNYGRQQVADQVGAITPLLAQLQTDPLSVQNPGVDESAFNTLKNTAVSDSLLRNQAEKVTKQNATNELIASIFGKQGARVSPDVVEKLAAQSSLFSDISPEGLGVSRRSAEGANGSSMSGVEGSILGEVDAAARKMMDNGAPGGAAYEVAAQAAKTKREELDRQYKAIEEAEKTSSELKGLSSNLRMSLQDAGDTGQAGQIKQTLSGLASYFSDDQAKKYAAGQLVESDASKIVGITGKSFKGPMSDRDVSLMLKQAPSLGNEKSTNQAILDRWDYAANLQSTYVDFMRSAQAKGVPVSQAEQAWKQIKQENPYVVKTKNGYEINPTWREGLDSLSAQTAQAPAPTVTTGGGMDQAQIRAMLRARGVPGY